jgi:hypothetical protein
VYEWREKMRLDRKPSVRSLDEVSTFRKAAYFRREGTLALLRTEVLDQRVREYEVKTLIGKWTGERVGHDGLEVPFQASRIEVHQGHPRPYFELTPSFRRPAKINDPGPRRQGKRPGKEFHSAAPEPPAEKRVRFVDVHGTDTCV